MSAPDAELLNVRFGARRVDVVDNGVDTTYFTPGDVARDTNRILFLGSLDWRPNQDAVGVLLDRIFPAVRAQVPDARLEIVGRNPPAGLVGRAQQLEGVELFASVPDVRPHLARCGLLAVPLRIGGGSRLKILEALAAGLPVVSSRVGAEGLHLEPGRDFIMVDDLEQMPAALVACLRDPELAMRTAAHGRQVVLERYHWDALADVLERVWARCLET